MHPADVLVFGPMILGLSLWPAIFFWVLFTAIFIELIFDQGVAATATLIVATAVAYYLGFWTLDFVYQYHTAFLWLLAFYIPIGIVWSTIKWWLYCSGVAVKVQKYLAEQTQRFQGKPDFDAQMAEVRDNLRYTFEPLPPWVSRHKSDLCRWMAWWPFSMVGSVFDDFLRRVFTAIYNAMGRVWQRVSDHTFRNIQITNPPPSPPPAEPTRTSILP